MADPQPSILVIRGGAIGDFILTLPALRLLRQTLPNCRVEVLGYPSIANLAVKAGLADGVRALEHQTMAPLFAKNAALNPELAAYFASFKLVISYLYDPDSILRENLERAGVKTLIECPHSIQPDAGHAAQQWARPLEKLAMWLEGEDWREPIFTPFVPAAAFPRLALHPGSGSEKKNWPLERWLKLAGHLRQTWPQAEIVFITGEAEEARGQLSRPEGVLSWHGLPLTELVDKLGTCTAFLGHDSGISHLAAACGLPCLLLFGPTDPGLWAPPQSRVQVLRAPENQLEMLDLEAAQAAAQAFLSTVHPAQN